MQQLIDPYRALGVARGATEAEIKAAHRKLVKRYHPDAGNQSETDRFLRVQEAYRVLSDPLLRKEWDQKHAPGPVRADRPATPVRRRRPAPRPDTESGQSSAPPRPQRPPSGGQSETDPRTRPRSSRAYTWSASEVPWWEESRTGTDKQKPNKKQKGGAAGNPKADANANRDAQGEQAAPPPSSDGRGFNQQDFDVYNRSSGAAWSSAARAYFRKGEADLPRRGSFRHEGTQVVTAGRARSAVEAESRRRAAAAAAAAANMADLYATAQTMAHAAPGPTEGTTHIVRRALPSSWPTIPQRLAYALFAWIPLAGVIAGTFANTSQIGLASALMAASLVLLVALPRIAYIAALSTVLVLIIGGIFLGAVFLSGSSPSIDRLALYVGGLLVVGYLGSAAAIVFGPPTLRPWSAQ